MNDDKIREICEQSNATRQVCKLPSVDLSFLDESVTERQSCFPVRYPYRLK